ncbi:MAG: hypothetical protein JWO10_2175 [Microbacteriaceae bacterium]|nr:hypothetical protein [Microbacteriaceae bacterium]
MSEPRASRSRSERGATESLLSIVLALEAVLVFFVALAAYALKVVPAGVAFGGGVVLIALLVLDSRLVRRPAGRWFGWLLQAALIATGILLPLMYFIGAGFLAIWIYCFITGRRLDARKAAFLAGTITETKETP